VFYLNLALSETDLAICVDRVVYLTRQVVARNEELYRTGVFKVVENFLAKQPIVNDNRTVV
jgi:hypothetical protein